MRFLIPLILSLIAMAPAEEPYNFWTDKRAAESYAARLEKHGYSSLDTWNLVWVLHEERQHLAVAAAYLLGRPGNNSELARKELQLELTRWRDPVLAMYLGGVLATIGSCEWTETALSRLEDIEDTNITEQIGIAREMARCKDFRGWPWVKRHLNSKTTNEIVFGEALSAADRFEMMDTGKGRRFSMAAELAELLETVAPERRAQVQRALDKVQGDTWRGKPNYDRLPTLPEKK